MKKGDRLIWKKVAPAKQALQAFLCFLLLIAVIPGELLARDKMIKIGIHGKCGPSRIEIVQVPNTRLFLGDVLVTEPILVENRSGDIYVKVGKRSFSKHGAVNLQSYGRGFWISGPEIPSRLYSGNLEISSKNSPAKRGSALKMINQLPLETYLVSVVAGETSDLNQKEALRAQAVAARTYTLAHIGKHGKDGFDLCDLTHCQLYAGFADISEDIRWAVDTTRGEVITYNGKLISAFYHSACGGRTESVVYVWPSIHKPYLTSVQDGPPAKPYCSSFPEFDWTTRIPVYQLQKIFSKLGWINPKDTLRRVKVSQRSPSGRALVITLYAGRETDVYGTDFYHGIGRTMGWNKIRSTLFELTMENTNIVFKGKGSGHGVGMCQWGAQGMAAEGASYREILLHYYPKTKIETRLP